MVVFYEFDLLNSCLFVLLVASLSVLGYVHLGLMDSLSWGDTIGCFWNLWCFFFSEIIVISTLVSDRDIKNSTQSPYLPLFPSTLPVVESLGLVMMFMNDDVASFGLVMVTRIIPPLDNDMRTMMLLLLVA